MCYGEYTKPNKCKGNSIKLSNNDFYKSVAFILLKSLKLTIALNSDSCISTKVLMKLTNIFKFLLILHVLKTNIHLKLTGMSIIL